MSEPGSFENRESPSPANPGQQAKIIKVMLTGDALNLSSPKEAIVVTPEERDLFLHAVASGTITRENWQRFIRSMAPHKPSPTDRDPKEAARVLMDKIRPLQPLCEVLRMIARGGFFPRIGEHEPANENDIEAMLAAYPDPVAFEERGRKIFDDALLQQRVGKRRRVAPRSAEYEYYLQALLRHVYGKRQEYWEQVKLLVKEAKEKYSDEVPTNVVSAEQPVQKMETTVSDIPWRKQVKFMENVEIHGEPQGGERLTPEMLKVLGLSPRYETNVQNNRIGLSAPYRMRGDRPALVAYIETRDPKTRKTQRVARTFYSSNSAAMWRYLPDRTENDWGGVGWFGKGYDQESCNIPFVVQKAVAEVQARSPHPIDLPEEAREIVFGGTAREYDPILLENTIVGLPLPENRERSYVLNVKANGKTLDTNFYRTENEARVPPERLVFEHHPELKPVFRQGPLLEWAGSNGLYEKINYEVFPSKDGTLRYLFCRDHEGRAWIGGIETASGNITSNGVWDQWVNGGDLTTPVYEYASEAHWPSGRFHPKNEKYVDLFQAYHNKIPVIQEYLEDVERRTRPPADRSAEEVKRMKAENRVREADSFGELFIAIYKLGKIVENGTVYLSAALNPLISDVWHGNKTVEELPSALGLRDKVRDFKRRGMNK